MRILQFHIVLSLAIVAGFIGLGPRAACAVLKDSDSLLEVTIDGAADLKSADPLVLYVTVKNLTSKSQSFLRPVLDDWRTMSLHMRFPGSGKKLSLEQTKFDDVAERGLRANLSLGAVVLPPGGNYTFSIYLSHGAFEGTENQPVYLFSDEGKYTIYIDVFQLADKVQIENGVVPPSSERTAIEDSVEIGVAMPSNEVDSLAAKDLLKCRSLILIHNPTFIGRDLPQDISEFMREHSESSYTQLVMPAQLQAQFWQGMSNNSTKVSIDAVNKLLSMVSNEQMNTWPGRQYQSDVVLAYFASRLPIICQFDSRSAKPVLNPAPTAISTQIGKVLENLAIHLTNSELEKSLDSLGSNVAFHSQIAQRNALGRLFQSWIDVVRSAGEINKPALEIRISSLTGNEQIQMARVAFYKITVDQQTKVGETTFRLFKIRDKWVIYGIDP